VLVYGYISNIDKIMVALVSKQCFILAFPATASFDELLLDRRGYVVLNGRYTIEEQLKLGAKYEQPLPVVEEVQPVVAADPMVAMIATILAQLTARRVDRTEKPRRHR
jgi:hypothetical protein